MFVLLNHHLADVLDFSILQLHLNRLPLNVQVSSKVVANIVEQRMVEGLINCHALIGVELKASSQEVLHICVDKLKDLTKWLTFLWSERLYVFSRSLVADEFDVCGCADDAENY